VTAGGRGSARRRPQWVGQIGERLAGPYIEPAAGPAGRQAQCFFVRPCLRGDGALFPGLGSFAGRKHAAPPAPGRRCDSGRDGSPVVL